MGDGSTEYLATVATADTFNSDICAIVRQGFLDVAVCTVCTVCRCPNSAVRAIVMFVIRCLGVRLSAVFTPCTDSHL